MADPHGPIIGEIDPEPVRDLLGAPRLGPSAVLARSVPAAVKRTVGPETSVPWGALSVRTGGLGIGSQHIVRSELGHPRPFGSSIGMPLGWRGPIAGRVRQGGCVPCSSRLIVDG